MSSGPYLCFKELLPPTNVLLAGFFQQTVNISGVLLCKDFLFAASSTVITIYSLEDCEIRGKRLKACGSFRLFGKPQCASVYSENGNSYLMLSFDVGKLLVLHYNPLTGSLETLQRFNLETDAFGVGSEGSNVTRSVLHSSRCASVPLTAIAPKHGLMAASFYHTEIFISSLLRDASSCDPLCRSFIGSIQFSVDIQRNICCFGSILDLSFTSSAKPTLLVLQDAAPLPIGHAAKVLHTCVLTALTVDVVQRKMSILWQRSQLPHDCLSIVSLERVSASAAIVISKNAVLLVTSSSTTAVAMNGLARTVVHPSIPLAAPMTSKGFELDHSRWIEPDANVVVGSLKDGEVVSIAFSTPEGDSSCCANVRFTVDVIGKSVRSSCFAASQNGLIWFLGSAWTDSVLLSADIHSARVEPTQIAVQSDSLSTPAAKRSRRTSRTSNGQTPILEDGSHLVANGEIQTEESVLYSEPLTIVGKSVVSKTCRLGVTDVIETLPPVVDGLFTARDELLEETLDMDWQSRRVPKPKPTFAAGYIAPREIKESLLLSAGLEESGELNFVFGGLKMKKLATREFAAAQASFSLKISAQESLLVISFPRKTRVFLCTDKGERSEKKVSDTEIQMRELSANEVGFLSSEETLAVAIVDDRNSIGVQVCAIGVRVIKFNTEEITASEAWTDTLVTDSCELGGFGGHEGEFVSVVDIVNDHVALMTSANKFHLLRYDALTESLSIVQQADFDGQCTNREESCSMDILMGSLHQNGHQQKEVVSGIFTKVWFQPSIVSLFHGVFPHTEVNLPEKSNQCTSGTESMEDLYLYRKESKNSHDSEPNGLAATSPSLYIIFASGVGDFVALQADSLKIVFHSSDLAKGQALLATDPVVSQKSEIPDDQLQSPRSASLCDAQAGDVKAIKDVRIARLLHEHVALSKLALVVVFETGDFTVYQANEIIIPLADGSCSHVANSFARVGHSVIGRRTRFKTRQPNFESNGVDELSEVSTLSSGISRLTMSVDLCGRNAILVPGARPAAVLNEKGLLRVLPVGFPEVPFANVRGAYSVSPLSFGRVKGVMTLWQEPGEEVVVQTPGSTTAQTLINRRILGLYQQPPIAGLRLHLDGTVTTKQIRCGRTVQFCRELLPKTDDKTEQALLSKKTLLLCCSQKQPTLFLEKVLTDEEKMKEDESYDRFFGELVGFSSVDESLAPPPPMVCTASSIVISQNGCVVDEFKLPLDEIVTGMEVLYLTLEKAMEMPFIASFGMTSKPPPTILSTKRVFVAVSTSAIDKHGEDTQGEGRLLFFSMDYRQLDKSELGEDEEAERLLFTNAGLAMAEDGTLLNQNITFEQLKGLAAPLLSQSNIQAKFLESIQPKLKLQWQGPGPASVVKQFGQYILSTVGPSVYIYKLNSSTLELEQISFYFGKFYISSVSIVKSLILLTDVYNCIELLAWREDDFSLTLLSKDAESRVALSSSFLWDGSSLGIAVGDDEANLQVFQFNPTKVESVRGSRLLALADWHVGSNINSMTSHNLLVPPLPPVPSLVAVTRRNRINSGVPFASTYDKASVTRSCLVLGTADGGIGVLLPVEEKIYRRLALLQQLMATGVPSIGSLNPKEFRVLRSIATRRDPKKGILDGSLLWRYQDLPFGTQEELATILGVQSDTILSNLHRLDASIGFF